MSLEAVVHVLSGRLQNEEKKRKLVILEERVAPASDKTDSPSPPSPPPEPDPLLVSKPVRDLICTVAHDRLAACGDYRQPRARSFLARVISSAFYTVQAIQPQPLGPRWAALYCICEFLVTHAYDDSWGSLNSSLEQLNHVKKDLPKIATSVGMKTGEGAAVAVVKSARQWSRMGTEELNGAFDTVWHAMADDLKVRFSVETVLWPCDRAHLLFQ